MKTQYRRIKIDMKATGSGLTKQQKKDGLVSNPQGTLVLFLCI